MTDQVIDYEKLTDRLLSRVSGQTLKHTMPSGTPTTVYGHGPGGLFSAPGLERPIFSAMTLPMTGLADVLPAAPNNTDNPYYGLFTGVTATTGSEKTNVCDDAPVAGLSKMCTHAFKWGYQSRATREIFINRVGRVNNRGEFTDFQFFGNPWADGNAGVPTMPGAGSMASVVNREVDKLLFELAVAWKRDFAREVYTGNPVNNSAGGGRKYYYGLDALINTGYRDAETNVLCPAADSLVQSFGNNAVHLAGTQLVRTLTYMHRNLRYIAERAGLTPVDWVFSMRWGLFYEITEIWPQAYNTYRNTTTDTTNQTLFNSAEGINKFRDDMRTGKYLLIDGEKVPVILDEAITETEPVRGVFSSTVYLVPLRALGQPVTYFEYFNYNVANGPREAAQILAPGGFFETTDGGRFLMIRKPPKNGCVQIQFDAEPRLLLLTPHIAGRLTNVRYTPLMHERDSFTDGGYFVNGGRTDRNGYGPSFGGPSGY